MTHEEHKARHQVLDEALGELMADYLMHTWIPRIPADVTVEELSRWSKGERREPTGGWENAAHSYSVCAHCGARVDEPSTHQCDAERMEHDR